MSTSDPTPIQQIKDAARAGRMPRLSVLRALDDSGDAGTLRQAGRALAALWKKGADADPSGDYRAVRVSLAAVSTPGPLEPLLRGTLAAAGMTAEITVGEYGAFRADLAAPAALFDGRDAVCLLLDDSWFWPRGWDGTSTDDLLSAVELRTEELCGLIRNAAANSTASLIALHTLPLGADLRNSLVSWRDRAALSRAWYRMNAALLELAELPGVVVADLTALLAESPVAAGDARLRAYADMPYTDEALLLLAREWRRALQARSGLSRKVLALDLDNTLWGGILGEAGPEGVEIGGLYPGKCYKELQRAALRLRNQGVMLALASKNDEEPVLRTLGEHPEVLLRPETFSARAVDWSPKAGNIKAMAAELNLSTSAFVFMDDSPFERGHVTAELPEVAVVSAEGDPAELAGRLLSRGWFDVLELTETDRRRPALYRERGERNLFQAGFASSEEFLTGLGITAGIRAAGPFDIQRVAQLAARTNQFNLTGVRFDAAETTRMAEDPECDVIACSVSDRFGEEGLVAAAWVRRAACPAGITWQVANLVMSCRVLGRGVELAVIAEIARRAAEAGAVLLEGRYLPTGRNAMAAEVWQRAGFTEGPVLDDGTRTFTLSTRQARELSPEWIHVQ
ncbi:HAD-IIIC family phosphatase [Streptomyces hawaiiensis]|uniref:HAD-IIIC family phosphatase n=1 Tax=Streptomyces hawaiiensis TaxID=67305 RepID=UPI00365F8A7B